MNHMELLSSHEVTRQMVQWLTPVQAKGRSAKVILM